LDVVESFFRSADQVAVVVRDIDRSMERYVDGFGIGPWRVYTFSPDWISDMTFRGRPQGYTMTLALSQLGDTMYELIQPVEGPSSYEEFLNERGEGLHHIGYLVEDIDAAIEEMEDKGFPVLQSGRGMGVEGDGAYAYFETEAALGHIIEAIELPGALPDPERTYPA
jgi:methylmalonyl-CoA/ethylmalonyl-CoA epimerase